MKKIVRETDVEQKYLYECERAFGFLMTEYGFKDPIISRGNLWIRTTYTKNEVGIETSVDLLDQMVGPTYIIKLENGKIPDVIRRNEEGLIIKEALLSLLIYRGVRDFSFSHIDVPKDLPKLQAEFRISLMSSAIELKCYGQDILAGSAKIFNGYHEPSPEAMKEFFDIIKERDRKRKEERRKLKN
jgi:hypothetical protein